MFSILFILFLVVVVIQVGYYGLLFSRFSFAKKQRVSLRKPPVSIIIACKNEEKNLKKNLSTIFEQSYPKFEIVLVDDASTDATLVVMQAYSNQFQNLQIIHIPKTSTYSGSKKNALTQAIQKAKYEHLLFTDADCVPRTKHWITNMSAHFTDKKQLVLGYGGYIKKKGCLNKLIRYETLMTAWQYFSYAVVGMPYMGVGRNISYTKTLFKKANGFTSHQDIKSGDDDLLVKQASTCSNVALNWQLDSHTLSEPKTNLIAWMQQKRRHLTTATSYKMIHQFLLGLFYISQVLFYALFFLLLFIYSNPKAILLIAGIRFLFFYISFIPTTKRLKESDLILYAPFLELFLITMQMRIFITNLWEKPKEW